MKSDNVSKYTEEPNTVLISESNTILSLHPGNIRFRFTDGTVSDYEISTIISINPLLFSNVNNNSQLEISLPHFITQNYMMDFIFIIKNGLDDLEDSPDNPEKIITLIKIADFFKNESISVQIINEIVMGKLNENNAFEYLEFSYEKLNNNKNNKDNEIDICYFDLFYKCLEIIGNNEHILLNNLERVKKFDKKIIDELLQKTFSHLLYNNYISIEDDNNSIYGDEIEPENYFETVVEGNENNDKKKTNFISTQNLNNLISFLFEINGVKNFFDLLTLENMSIFSSESINELNNEPNPTFQIKIPFEVYNNYYEEFPTDIIINNKIIIFVIFYKITDDSFNICIKFGETKNKKIDNNNPMTSIEDNFCFKIFTFLTIAKLYKGNDKNPISSQTKMKCLSNNKSSHIIFKLTNFTTSMNKNNSGIISLNSSSNEEYFTVSVNLKLCYIHSVLTSFFLRNFSLLCNQDGIHKISKQLLLLVLKNKYLNKKSENDIVIGINKWLNDEINIKEDITEVFEIIKWEKVYDEYIFELIFKYSNMIVGNEALENLIIQSFQKKYFNSQYIPQIISSLFRTASIINYSNLFTLMKKNEKFNLAYMSSMHMNPTTNSVGSVANISNEQMNCLKKSGILSENSRNIIKDNFKNENKKLNTTSKKIKMTKKIVKNSSNNINNKNLINYLLSHNIDVNSSSFSNNNINKIHYNHTTNNSKGGLMSKLKTNSNIIKKNSSHSNLYISSENNQKSFESRNKKIKTPGNYSKKTSEYNSQNETFIGKIIINDNKTRIRNLSNKINSKFISKKKEIPVNFKKKSKVKNTSLSKNIKNNSINDGFTKGIKSDGNKKE